MTDVLDAIAQGYRDSLAAVPYGDGHLISLPTTFTSGNCLTLLVTIDGATVTVTDRGLVSDELADAGLDISTSRVSRSFDAIRNSTGFAPQFGAEPWEIAVTADAAELAVAIQSVADAAIRADGLCALSPTRRAATFADQSIVRVAQRTAVIPRAKMRGRHGSERRVTLSYLGRDTEAYYVQALSAGDNEARVRSFDHATGIFVSAAPSISHRIALLQRGEWEAWQVQTLKEVCQVVDEDRADQFINDTAA